ncbi:Stp1/IreP family PP2C-type Ser/Thr phosphatase [Lacticigenium naphthae]|uniref:Stp1/IreP family PP2C-type Ser/Thr phosphatase n=1 Tax=Lacticigenium naphthae TaxID=515351 RepID=UPI00042768F5|nr:Stp1/IreP family PP2C-type Ser/Thr phosphatase [Lacticigenium naphthae]
MQFSMRTHLGKVRKTNQDYIGLYKNKNDQVLAVLCDGMGGHNAGDVASEMAATHLGHAWSKNNLLSIEEIKQWMTQEVNVVNKEIHKKSLRFEDFQGMGSTIVVAVFLETVVLFGNLGDSRGYILTNDQLIQITEDHSYVNELMKKGQITMNEAKKHPNRNVITRSLGIASKVEMDYFSIPYTDFLSVLLCSDGLTNQLSDETIHSILRKDIDKEEKVDTLLDGALENGGTDNISIVYAEKA